MSFSLNGGSLLRTMESSVVRFDAPHPMGQTSGTVSRRSGAPSPSVIIVIWLDGAETRFCVMLRERLRGDTKFVEEQARGGLVTSLTP